jgi:16S rRNA (uracil1498-N3)-methyltransferase
MARRRFFVERVENGEAALTGEDAQHLARVLRVRPGQQFELSDNEQAYLAEVLSVQKDSVRFRILEAAVSSFPATRVTLVVSLFKFDRFEWMVEKATELGASVILPVEATRSEKGLLEAGKKRVERWRRISRESSQQSRRVRLPEIEAPSRLADALDRAPNPRFALEEMPGAKPLAAALRDLRRPAEIALAIGPEGGWAEPDRIALQAAGFEAVSLGNLVLRAETACIAALAVVCSTFE